MKEWKPHFHNCKKEVIEFANPLTNLCKECFEKREFKSFTCHYCGCYLKEWEYIQGLCRDCMGMFQEENRPTWEIHPKALRTAYAMKARTHQNNSLRTHLKGERE